MGVQKFKRPVLITARADQVVGEDDVEIDVLQQSEQGGGGGVSPTIVEQDTGLTWLDGSTPVYQKTFAIALYPNNSTVVAATHGITGLDQVIDAYGHFKSSGGTWYPLGRPHATSTNNAIDVIVDATEIKIQSIFNWAGDSPTDGYVTLLYTKTA